MLEIRFHGRGGQGTVVATILMSKAFFRAGYQVQSFPFFGVERRGAPVEAYLRLDKAKDSSADECLHARPCRRPGPDAPCEHRCHAGNEAWRDDPHQQPRAPSECSRPSRVPPRLRGCQPHRPEQPDRKPHPPHRQHLHDGGCCPRPGMPPLDDVFAAIRDEVPGDAERNVAAAQEAYEAVRFVEPAKSAA